MSRRWTKRAEVYAALVLATRDYVEKNGFRSVVLGLSGGIDSALVATIAVDALGAERVHTIGMPSRWSSDHSVDDARDLAQRQGISYTVIPIEPMVVGLPHRARGDWRTARTRRREPPGPGPRHHADGAVQRARPPGADDRQQERAGHRLLDAVRRLGRRLRADQGRLQDAWSGSCAGGATPRPSVAARRRRSRRTRSPSRRPPSSPRARSTPTACPSYEILDALLDDYIEGDLGHDALIAAGHDPALVERVIRMVDVAEYKRRQYPPGPKTTLKAFGRDRRLPITSRWREIAAPHVGEPEQARPDQATE